MRNRLSRSLFIASILCMLVSTLLWIRSYRRMDDVFWINHRRTIVTALLSTNGNLAFQTSVTYGPGQLTLHGMHYEQGPAINLHKLGWPVDYDLSFGGFMIRRFRSLLTSTAGLPYVIKWTTLAIPYWFITAILVFLSSMSARMAFDGRTATGFSPTMLIRRWLNCVFPVLVDGA